jgi:hypothetical protein
MHSAQGKRGRAASLVGTEGRALEKPLPDPGLVHEVQVQDGES